MLTKLSVIPEIALDRDIRLGFVFDLNNEQTFDLRISFDSLGDVLEIVKNLIIEVDVAAENFPFDFSLRKGLFLRGSNEELTLFEFEGGESSTVCLNWVDKDLYTEEKLREHPALAIGEEMFFDALSFLCDR